MALNGITTCVTIIVIFFEEKTKWEDRNLEEDEEVYFKKNSQEIKVGMWHRIRIIDGYWRNLFRSLFRGNKPNLVSENKVVRKVMSWHRPPANPKVLTQSLFLTHRSIHVWWGWTVFKRVTRDLAWGWRHVNVLQTRAGERERDTSHRETKENQV